MPRDIERSAQRRQRVPHALDAEEREELLGKALRVQIHKSAAGIVGDFGARRAGQAEAHIILALKHPAYVFHRLRFVIPQPREQTHRLACHNVLTGEGERPFLRAVLAPLDRVSPRAVVRREDAAPRALAVLAPEIQALPVAAEADARDLFGAHAALFEHAADDGAVIAPHLLHIPLDKAGRGRESGGGDALHGYLRAVRGKEGSLCVCAAVVQSKVIAHKVPPILRRRSAVSFFIIISCIIPRSAHGRKGFLASFPAEAPKVLMRSQTRPTALGSRLKGLRLAAAHSLRSHVCEPRSIFDLSS